MYTVMHLFRDVSKGVQKVVARGLVEGHQGVSQGVSGGSARGHQGPGLFWKLSLKFTGILKLLVFSRFQNSITLARNNIF